MMPGKRFAFLISIETSGRVDKTFLKWLYSKGQYDNTYILKGEYLRSQDALIKCCKDSTINTVLDVGCGMGHHSRILAYYGKKVTGIDASFSPMTDNDDGFKLIRGNFDDYQFESKFDLVWCSHVLEHQINVGEFINRLFCCCSDKGKVAITVPDTHGRIDDGHVSLFNLGYLMYSIIASGYSCKHACGITRNGDISVICPNERIDDGYDYRNRPTREYFPECMAIGKTRFGGIRFDGNISSVNW